MSKLDHIFSRKYKVYTNNQGNINKNQHAVEGIEEETSRNNLKLFKLIKIVGQNLYIWHIDKVDQKAHFQPLIEVSVYLAANVGIRSWRHNRKKMKKRIGI